MSRSDNIDRRGFLRAGALLAASAFLPITARATERLGSTQASGAFAIGGCGGLDRAAVFAQHGVAFLEVNCRGTLMPDKPEAEFAKSLAALRKSPVPARAANSFLPGHLKCTGPDANHDKVLAYAEIAFERAARAGIHTITFGSSGARSIPEGTSRDQAELQFVALLARMGDRARKHGVTVSVEPLQSRETNFIHRVSEARRLVAAVQNASVRITADVFHMMREDEGPESIREAGPLIHHVHIAEKAGRTAPGTAGDNFTPYLRALRDIDYRGGISFECRWSDLAAQVPVAVETLRAQLEELE